ncbi:MAG: hypothetical protein ACJAS6_001310 [Rickettsiales bacterium]|jgi:hypothetical protein
MRHNFFQFSKSPKNLLAIFISSFAIFSAYFLYANIKLHSLKISYYYLLAKIYVVAGWGNFEMNITGSFGMSAARKAIDVANNFYVIKIYDQTISGFLASVFSGFGWALFLTASLALLIFVKKLWRNKKALITNSRFIQNILVRIDNFGDQSKLVAKTAHSEPAQIHQKPSQPKVLKKIKSKAVLSSKSENIKSEKVVEEKPKNYRLVADDDLPYPILNRAVFFKPNGASA